MPDLTKWPLLLVKGEPVTEQQANEILVRTISPWGLSVNDQDWNRTTGRILGITVDKHGSHDYQSTKAVSERLGVLDLEYLYTSRIASAWIGGPKGWCDWDGRIGCNNYNIGKWPSEESVTDDWATIAAAFPYLVLTAQLVTDEGEGELVAEWRVQCGTVAQREPGKQIRLMAEPSFAGFFMGGRERGVSPDRLEVAVAQVLEAHAG